MFQDLFYFSCSYFALTETADVDGCKSLTVMIRITAAFFSCFRKEICRRRTTKWFNRIWEVPLLPPCAHLTSGGLSSRVCLFHLYLFFNDECEMFLWMSTKQMSDQWWCCNVWFAYVRECSSCYDASDWGLQFSTLTTRGRMTKQLHSRALWIRCFQFQIFLFYFNEFKLFFLFFNC